MRQRNQAIDILKGIGILLVLVAHSLEGFVSQFAYTFHMPLFFIATGLFFTPPQGGEKDGFRKALLRDSTRLLLPAVATTLLILLVSALSWLWPGGYLISPLTLSGLQPPRLPIDQVLLLGNLWFLYALFFARQAFGLLASRLGGWWLGGASLLVGALAAWGGQHFRLPLQFLQGLSVVPFLWVGYALKQRGGADQGMPRWAYLSIPLWALYVFYGKLNISFMVYAWGYLPDLVAACGGVLFFYQVSKAIASHTRYASPVLAFLGVHSLILICAPTVETYLFPFKTLLPAMPLRSIAAIAGKTLWCALALYGCLRIPVLRKLFGIR